MDLNTKNLVDIPELLPKIRFLDYPIIQYTFREVLTGLQFIAYGQERSLTLAALLASVALKHL